MQNVLKRKNMYLEGFQVILNQNHTITYTILHLLKCISKNYEKNECFVGLHKKNGFCCTAGQGWGGSESYGPVHNY